MSYMESITLQDIPIYHNTGRLIESQCSILSRLTHRCLCSSTASAFAHHAQQLNPEAAEAQKKRRGDLQQQGYGAESKDFTTQTSYQHA